MMRAHAWVVTIGDELLRGEIVDSNKSLLSERLLRLDVETERHVTVPDAAPAIDEVLRAAAARARVVLVSGGLGPTRDDITTEVAARTFGRRLRRDEGVLKELRRFFQSFGREMAPNNAKQADFPEGAEVLPNPIGTAPGFMLEVEGALLFFMPGVPRELIRMLDVEVLPRLEARLGGQERICATLIRTFGLGESNLDRELADLATADAKVTLGFRTQFPDNLVRVVARGADEAEASARLRRVVEEVRERLGSLVVTEGDDSLAQVVGRLLREKSATVAVAESCTGGLIASRLTDLPGSSAYFLGGVVAYANDTKVRELGVDPAVLAADGAVSERVAQQMAEGIRMRAQARLGVATTGIAGPEGGSAEKPVGTTWLALADGEQTHARRYALMRDRGRNRELATHLALEWLRRRLLGLELPASSFPRLARPPGGKS